MIEVDIKRKIFTTAVVMRDVCFSIPNGNVLGVVGLPGTGRSTLLRIATGLGRNSRDEVAAPAKSGTVFHDPMLLAWRSVRDNLTLRPSEASV